MSGIAVAGNCIKSNATFESTPCFLTVFAKRNLDVIVGIMLLVAVLPLSLFIACLIKFFDKGPIFYRHVRVGRNGRSFCCLKFRTMRLDADVRLRELLRVSPEMEAEWQSTGKLRYDPRVTGIGHLLRKTSLDELPQIINVLRGDMSLVGPRPVLQSEIDLHYHGDARVAYFAVRPGITGLWQVSGRSSASYARRVELDTEYVRTLSVFRDIALLARTIFVVVACNGAY